jgi:putative nucleotidyltransferase with HDIG domain
LGAPPGATVLDRELTERNRDAAAELVPPQYDVRAGASGLAQADLRAILEVARSEIMAADLARSARPHLLAPDSTQPAAQNRTGDRAGLDTDAAPLESISVRISRLNANLARPLPVAAARQILQTPAERWRIVAREAMAALRAAYEYEGRSQKIRSDVADDRLAARRRMLLIVKERAPRVGLKPDEVETAFLLASAASLAPNLVVNEDKTEHARDAARDNVPQVFRSVAPGSVVVEAGTRIDAERRAELQDLDVVTPRFAWSAALARLALCIVIVCFAAGYIARLHPQLETQAASLWLAAMVPIAFVALFRWLLRAPHGDLSMVPIGAIAALMLTMLINERMGMLAAFSVPALCALVARAEPGLFLAAALSAAVGVLGVAEISSRSHIARAALLLSGTNAVLALALGLLREASAEETIYLACWGIFGGGGSVLAAVGLAQMLERPFNITTHLRLLELTGADEAVMRRMQSEAPGTYTHSLMVGLLSEAAAKAVGADALLCRVGGLYHDIGKLRRPHCFVENQSGENVHDQLSPHFSALLIVAHVRDGIELGRAIRLPQPVIDIIAQHHGTSLIAYFYHRAKNIRPEGSAEIDRTPDENLFRYPGPKPQSKEAAIVLLADTVEASSRALPNLSIDKLEAHIRAMLHARQADGELSECDLTMRDLGKIESSFAHVLRGVLHHRIEYPDPATDDENWVQDTLSAHETDRRAENRLFDARRADVRRPDLRNSGQRRSEPRRNESRTSGRSRGQQNSTSRSTEDNSHDPSPEDGGAVARRTDRNGKPNREPGRNRVSLARPRGLTRSEADAASEGNDASAGTAASEGSAEQQRRAPRDAKGAGRSPRMPKANTPGVSGAAAPSAPDNFLEPRRSPLVRLANGRIVRKDLEQGQPRGQSQSEV